MYNQKNLCFVSFFVFFLKEPDGVGRGKKNGLHIPNSILKLFLKI